MNLLPSSKPAHDEHWTLPSQLFDVSYSETSSDSEYDPTLINKANPAGDDEI